MLGSLYTKISSVYCLLERQHPSQQTRLHLVHKRNDLILEDMKYALTNLLLDIF